MSVVPPAVKETTNLMGLSGYSARAVPQHRDKAMASQARRHGVGEVEAIRKQVSPKMDGPIMLTSGD